MFSAFVCCSSFNSIISQYLTILTIISQYLTIIAPLILYATSQVAEWCPDINKHTAPLGKMQAWEVGRLFGGLPAWQLSYWACMAGPIPTNIKTQALKKPASCFFEALDRRLAPLPHLASELAPGMKRYVPVPGIAEVVGTAVPTNGVPGLAEEVLPRPGAAAAAAARKRPGAALAAPAQKRKQKDARQKDAPRLAGRATKREAAGTEQEAARAEPVASARCSPALYHHYSSSPVLYQYRQYYNHQY